MTVEKSVYTMQGGSVEEWLHQHDHYCALPRLDVIVHKTLGGRKNPL